MGTLQILFWYSSSNGRIAVGDAMSVAVTPGIFDASSSSVRCALNTGGEITADTKTTSCQIQPRDQFDNNLVIKNPNVLNALSGTASFNGLSVAHSEVIYDVILSKYIITFGSFTKTGEWSVLILQSTTGTAASIQIGKKTAVYVKNGNFDPVVSTVHCPTEVPGAADGKCFIQSNDQYGNAVPPTYAQAIQFVATFEPTPLNFRFEPEEKQFGYSLTYATPALAGIFNLTVLHRGTTSTATMLATTSVQVIQMALNVNQSITTCNVETSVTANDLVTCSILPVDEHGAALENSALSSAFQVTVFHEGIQQILTRADVTYDGVQPGLYTASFRLPKTGTYSVTTLYNAGTRSVQLVGPSFDVVPGLIDVASSKFVCTSLVQTQGAAMCTVMYRDIYFNDVPITSSDLIAHLVIDSKNELDVVVGVSTFSALGK